MNKIFIVLVLIFLSILLFSWTKQQDDEFTFQKGNQKLTLKLGNGKRYLNWNIKTTLKLKYENIDPQKMRFSAPGISFSKFGNTKKITILSITPDKNVINSDTLNLFISGPDLNDSIWYHKFKILIKDK